MNKAVQSLLALLILFASAGCIAPAAAIESSSKSRIASPAASDADLAELVSGNTDLALDLYHELRQKGEGNLFYSPFSISAALAMTYAGARGETEAQMAATLHYLLPQTELHPAFNRLDLEMDARSQNGSGEDGEGFRLHIVNALWGQQGYTFLDEFLDTLAENYGAGLRLLDFAGAPEQSRQTINDWVSQQTEKRIQDLIPPDLIDAATALVLTNAIYFNAAWQHPFDVDRTTDGVFQLLDGQAMSVPLMHVNESFGYAAGPDYEAIELPYQGGQLSMIVLLPAPGEFTAFEQELDQDTLNAIIAALASRPIALSMPKYEIESEFRLKGALSAMGMPIAFSGSADFSGMTGNRELFIGDVVHKAFVSVDEAGTEAAAATAVVMLRAAAPGEPLEVEIDRPFIMMIRDVETQAPFCSLAASSTRRPESALAHVLLSSPWDVAPRIMRETAVHHQGHQVYQDILVILVTWW